MDNNSEEIENEMEKIKKNPNKYISDWMEKILLHVGKRVFNLLAIELFEQDVTLKSCSHPKLDLVIIGFGDSII